MTIERIRIWPQLLPGMEVKDYLRELYRVLTEESAERVAEINAAIGDTSLYLKADGTIPLSANWDAGDWEIRSKTFHSDVVTGTAPLTIASTTLVSNLNADLWDGYQFADYLDQPVKTSSSVVFKSAVFKGAAASNSVYDNCYSATLTHYPNIALVKSHSATLDTGLQTVSGDYLGRLGFLGHNSADTAVAGAYLLAVQNGAAGTYVPTDLRVYTYDAETSHVAMAFTKSGGVHIGGTSDVADNNLLVDGATTSAGGFQTGSVTGLVPEGTIIAWVGGYFQDGANGTYTRALGADNTVAAVNTLWNPSGWHVCDGAALNLATSTIFDGAGRYLPYLTDDRFLMGSTVCGGIGGNNAMAHTHGYSSTSGAGTDHSHGAGTYASANHTHALSLWSSGGEAHSHSVDPPATTSGGPSATWKPDAAVGGTTAVASGDHTHSTNIASFSSGSESAHRHTVNGNTGSGGGASITGTSATESAHTHRVSGTTDEASNTENRPKYLSVFYLMYVRKAA